MDIAQTDRICQIDSSNVGEQVGAHSHQRVKSVSVLREVRNVLRNVPRVGWLSSS